MRYLQTVAVPVFIVSAVTSSFVWFSMHRSVNAKLPQEDQIPYIYVWRVWERYVSILRLYRQFFPKGRLLLAYWIFSCLAVLAWFMLIIG
jgi:hypothetical protein